MTIFLKILGATPVFINSKELFRELMGFHFQVMNSSICYSFSLIHRLKMRIQELMKTHVAQSLYCSIFQNSIKLTQSGLGRLYVEIR